MDKGEKGGKKCKMLVDVLCEWLLKLYLYLSKVILYLGVTLLKYKCNLSEVQV